MECPYDIPVEKEISAQFSGKTFYRIIDANKRSIAVGLTEKNADYIVQAINNYEKLKTVAHNLAETMGIDYAIKKLSISDDNMTIGAATILKGIQAQAKQALPKEKP